MTTKQLAVIIAVSSLLLGACAAHNGAADYWNARRAAIAALPPNQRAQGQIDLMRDQFADQQMRRQALSNSLAQNNANMDAITAARIQSINQPGSFGNPIYFKPMPSYNPPPVPVLTGVTGF
jgi:septal ring factor EnvC (AmiA/AmiB activator)